MPQASLDMQNIWSHWFGGFKDRCFSLIPLQSSVNVSVGDSFNCTSVQPCWQSNATTWTTQNMTLLENIEKCKSM
jgi:hypothetical protein